jgi:nondiscriminating glutamyl-tRNA synthetase
MNPVRVRMAPSPTGFFHIGSARTTLFNYLFAKHAGGTFVLRIEDTDAVRSTKEFEQNILDSIRWLGLDWDEGPGKEGNLGPYHQIDRIETYRKYGQELLSKELAYYCYCTPTELEAEREEQRRNKQPPKYSGKCRQLTAEQAAAFEKEGRSKVLRFRMPDKKVTVHDMIKGDIDYEVALFGDLVLIKADGIATYNFANVIDDHLMQISHVIRGDDHISNTPKQILLYEAFGFYLPQFAHIPMILNPDRSKMSKRAGPTSVTEYQEAGYLPEALVNFLALLGWSPGDDREMFSLAELGAAFSLDHVQPSPAIFNIDKLKWFNGQYIRQLPQEELLNRLTPFLQPHLGERLKLPSTTDYLKTIMPLVFERLEILGQIWELVDFFFADQLEYDVELLQAGRHEKKETISALQYLQTRFQELETFDTAGIERVLRSAVEELGWKTGELFMFVRFVQTSRKASPPLFETMAVLGKERVLARLAQAAGFLEKTV